MRACVTGASGFVGRHVVEELRRRGYDVTALARTSSVPSALAGAGVHVALGDVRDLPSLTRAFSGQDAVIHLAAAMNGDWKHSFQVGGQGTQNVIDAAATTGVTRLVHISSCVVYRSTPGVPVTESSAFVDDPWNAIPYDRQKILAEQLVWQAHEQGRITVTVVRPPTVIGPGDPYLIPKIEALMTSTLGAIANDGRSRFPYVVVDDLAAGIVDATVSDVSAGRAYNLCASRPITKDEFVAVFRSAGLTPPRRRTSKGIVIDIMAGGLRLLELPYRRGTTTDFPPPTQAALRLVRTFMRGSVEHDFLMDCSRAISDLGWRGTADLRDAAHRTVQWHRLNVGEL